jgi:hypothetical protein
LAREYMMLTLRSIQFCHANNKQVIMRCCSYNYGLIVLDPNCTRHRMITYTYLQVKDETSAGCRKPFVTQFLIPSTGVIGMTSYRLILFFHINVMTSLR